jgi:asparagine synthase (glutamine-hydrolysing)
VLLSGAGGDDLFSGYRRHRALAIDRYISALPRPGRGLIESAARRLDDRVLVFRRLAKLFAGASLNGDARLVNYFAWTRPEILDRLWTDDVRASLSSDGCVAPFFEFLQAVPAHTPPLERLLALEQRFFLADHNLIYTDKMAMAVGVEARVPFLDGDLVELAARIPPHAKQRGKCGKWVLKEAMKPFLPADVIHRPKTGFGAPVRRWIRSDIRPLLLDVLSTASVKRRGIFEPREIERLMAANDAGRIDGSYTLLSLLCVELWCRAFLDHQRPPALAAAFLRG